ncbi:MAG TPA: ferritin-like domain-containing protein [Spirosoma sp.]|jgi:hypothetical protein|nr:ferritin-like domain-containing protein [Spirosoma sp.]
MEKLTKDPADTRQLLTGKESAAVGRRMFMRYVGVTAAAGVALTSCKDQIVDPSARGAREGFATVDLGDIGVSDTSILNYAYALEQLEAAFYTQVVMTPYMNMPAGEMMILKDIRDHEIVHREFLKAALGRNAIPNLTPDFSMIDFRSRASVLGTARQFEDIGVSAYNGAAQFIMDAGNLAVAGKIVSVEARHAAIIATLLDPRGPEFAGDRIIYPDGREEIRVPVEVLALVAPFIKETINGMQVRRKV